MLFLDFAGYGGIVAAHDFNSAQHADGCLGARCDHQYSSWIARGHTADRCPKRLIRRSHDNVARTNIADGSIVRRCSLFEEGGRHLSVLPEHRNAAKGWNERQSFYPAAAIIICPIFSDAKNSCDGTLPANTPKNRLIWA